MRSGFAIASARSAGTKWKRGREAGTLSSSLRFVTTFLRIIYCYQSSSTPNFEMGKKKKIRVSEENTSSDQEFAENQNQSSGSSSNQRTLYEILGVETTASQQEIKKAYHRLALRLHPDKNPGDDEAKEKFQQLQKVISILGDEEKRALYDQTGCVDDADLIGDVSQNLKDYFQTLYKKVTEADIEEFEANYRGSDTEKKDLIDLYKAHKGNMNRIFCYMLCSDPLLDSHRFKDVLDEAIATGELKSTRTYEKWAKRVSETKPPSPRNRKQKKEKKSEDLFAIISQRQNQRKTVFSSLMSKYGGEPAQEPSEEEFEAARSRLESRRKCKRK